MPDPNIAALGLLSTASPPLCPTGTAAARTRWANAAAITTNGRARRGRCVAPAAAKISLGKRLADLARQYLESIAA